MAAPRRLRGGLVLCFGVVLALHELSFVVPSASRRDVVRLLSAVGAAGVPVQAKAAAPNIKADKERLVAGYKDLVYMMNNFDTVTRKCDKNQDRISQALQSGTASPNACIAQPLTVRKYLGQTSIKANLFDTKQMLVNFELAGMVPNDKEDEYGDLVEEFERCKRESDEWAYSSSWAEANPGGGRDRTEDYLLRSKRLADSATKNLGRIVEILGVSDNLYQ
mmetsp:Transcript_22067/g.41586  ORF Transcript_22067/g.41586 Transcript_22067/m.41586 type:complete len:221 (+) Transcript_22067:48-710(+)